MINGSYNTNEQLKAEQKADCNAPEEFDHASTHFAVTSPDTFIAEFFHASKDLASFLDLNYTYLSVNPAYSHYFGKPVEAIVGSSVAELLGADVFQSSIKPQFDRCLSGEHVSFEGWFLFPALGPRYMSVSYYPKLDNQGMVAGVMHISRDSTARKKAEEDLKRIDWMLSSKPGFTIEASEETHDHGYGDLTELNRDGLILKFIGKEPLSIITKDYMELLGTSSAIYEANGDYAFGIFASGWCRMMDSASRNLCDASDNLDALNSGQWLCHESCWTDCSKEAIARRAPVDIACSGGIRLFATPIFAGGNVVGAINFGYGDPPRDPERLKMLGDAYHLNDEDLLRESTAYDSRPPYIIEMAKRRLLTTAKLIGLMVETKQAKEALKESDERFRALHNASFGGIAIHDKGVILECNLGLSTITGFHYDELIGMDGLLLIAEQSREQVMNNILSGYEKPYEAFGVRKNGEEYPLRLEARNIPYKGKNVRVVEFRDITEQKRAEVALRESEEKHRSLFETMTQGVVYHAADGTIISANPAAERILGLSFDQMHGKTSMDPRWEMIKEDGTEVPGTDHPAMIALRTGETVGPVVRGVFHPDKNTHIWLSITAIPLFQSKWTTPHQVYATFEDITERRRAEIELVASEKKLHSLFNAMVELVVLHEIVFNELGEAIDYRILDCNPAFTSSTGLTHQDVIGRLASEVYGVKPAPYLDVYTHVALTGESYVFDSYYEKMNKYFKISAVSYERNSFATITADITEARVAQDALYHAKVQAESANRAKSEFLANMSHEIRTPLNGIMGMLQLLETTDLNVEQEDYTHSAFQACRRLTILLTDILDLSRIEAGKLNLASAPFSLIDIFKQLQDLFAPIAKKSGVALNLIAALEIPATVTGDATRLQQILINLVGNALKFTSSGSVTLEASPLPSRRPEEYRVLFCVTDTGIGIPDDKLNTLFHPFSQVSQGFTKQYQGAGLGLSICKRLIELMGGNINIESELGVGTSLYFCIPFGLESVADEVTAEVNVKMLDSQASAIAGLRVLVAEDDQISGILASQVLNRGGATFKIVEDGEQVLAALRQDHFDLVLMDVQMPVMDGVEATRAIRSGKVGSDKQNIPIIAMTAYALAGDKEKFLDAGMNGYVSKPILIDDLVFALTCALTEKQRASSYIYYKNK